jgi:hypothetical protein
MRISADTLDEINHAIDRMVAIADYARHGAITDERAAAAGFYADEGLGTPETLLYGPDGAFERGCDIHEAWEEHAALSNGEAEYHVTAHDNGAMTMTMQVPGADPDGLPVELTVGMNDRAGLHADPATVLALGGSPAHPPTGVRSAVYDRDTGMARDLENLAGAGVPEEARERVWTALNEASHSHPDARLARHWVHDDDRRDLPRHDTVDRAVGTIRREQAPDPPVSPAPAGAETARRRSLDVPEHDAAYSR